MKNLSISSRIKNYEVNFINNIQDALQEEGKDDIFVIDKFVNSKLKLNRKNNNILIRKRKNFSNLNKIIQKLLNLKVTRETKIISIGGGVVQDVSSFLSSIIFRGIEWHLSNNNHITM